MSGYWADDSRPHWERRSRTCTTEPLVLFSIGMTAKSYVEDCIAEKIAEKEGRGCSVFVDGEKTSMAAW